MTTFQQFRRSQHNLSKSNSRFSMNSSKSNIVSLQFSINEIIFTYDELALTLHNTQLKISNMGHKSVYFKILSNSAQTYEISPSQDIIEPSASSQILFKLKKGTISLGPSDVYPNEFAKIKDLTKNHIFQVHWAQCTEQELLHNKLPQLKHKQLLTVKLVEPYGVQQSRNGKNNHFPPYEEASVSKQLGFLDENRSFRSPKTNGRAVANNNFILNTERVLRQQRMAQEVDRGSLLTTPIIAIVAIVAFLLGYMSA